MSSPKKSKSSSSSSSSSDETFKHSDLLTELIAQLILLFLPIESVLKFRSVCKDWNLIIGTPSFRLDHTLLHHSKPHHPVFLLQDKAVGIPSRFFSFHPTTGKLTPFPRFPYSRVKILQSCNGLLLLKCRHYDDVCVLRRYLVVFNPTTMVYRELKLPRSFVSFNGISMVFDPFKSPYYKVYCFRKLVSKPIAKPLLAVYDSETHTWTEREGTYCPNYRLHGGFYWRNNICFLRSRSSPRRFSLEDEKVKYMDYPPRGREYREYCKVESNGYVNFVWVSSLRDKKCLGSFELLDDFSWSKVYKFDLDTCSLTDREKRRLSFLGMVRAEKIGDSVLLFHVPGKILKYESRTFKVVVNFSEEGYGDLQFGSEYAHQFIPTLADV